MLVTQAFPQVFYIQDETLWQSFASSYNQRYNTCLSQKHQSSVEVQPQELELTTPSRLCDNASHVNI